MQNSPSFGLLSEVKEGMQVYDNAGDKIGTVSFVQMGAEDPNTPEIEAVTVETHDYLTNDLLEDFAAVLGDNTDIPDEIKARMLRSGFIRIDTGLLQADCVAMHSQVEHVADDRVMLSIRGNELMRV